MKARFEASGFITSAVIRARCAGACGSLSSLMPTNVAFSGGVSSPEYVEFSMERKTLSAIDCSKGGVLGWQALEINGGSDIPCEMNASGPHIVYTILDEPKPPWDNKYGEMENAWTNALEFAIVKAGAQGNNTDKDALAAVTTYLHGSFGLLYDTIGGEPNYKIGAKYYLTDFMCKVSHGKSGNPGNVVCCYDMAASTCSFGSIVGANVHYCFMLPFGYINTVDLIGVGDCNNPFYSNPKAPSNAKIVGDDDSRTGFGNHAFAECNNLIFDACAGPVLGKTRSDYLSFAIDSSTPAEARRAGGITDISVETFNIE